jgi:hypothetical protein
MRRRPESGGGQPIYSAIAIETGLALRLGFHQPLRQAEGLLRSIANVLGVGIAIPDHATLSRRSDGLTILPMRLYRAEPLPMSQIKRVGIDTSKAVFTLHGVD